MGKEKNSASDLNSPHAPSTVHSEWESHFGAVPICCALDERIPQAEPQNGGGIRDAAYLHQKETVKEKLDRLFLVRHGKTNLNFPARLSRWLPLFHFRCK